MRYDGHGGKDCKDIGRHTIFHGRIHHPPPSKRFHGISLEGKDIENFVFSLYENLLFCLLPVASLFFLLFSFVDGQIHDVCVFEYPSVAHSEAAIVFSLFASFFL
jgi:hypothetical protein